MKAKGRAVPDLTWKPLTPRSWDAFEALFGPRGACGGCWCMWWRLTRSEFERRKGEGNRKAMQALVDSGHVPGLLAFRGRKAVGWCAVAPRAAFPSINRSRVLKPVDQRPVWSLPCFYVPPEERGQGLMEYLAQAACAYVQGQGGAIVEAYPTAPRGKRLSAVSSFMGLPEVLARAGFEEVARPSAARVVMRRFLDGR